MNMPPEQRVRCIVDAGAKWGLRKGLNYTVSRTTPGFVWLHEVANTFGFAASRFKPVVRVKMGRAVA